MRKIAVAAVLLATNFAYADDPNRWQAWVSPSDGQSNAVDVSMLTADGTCGKKPFIRMQPRFRNRYQDHIAGKLTIEHFDVDGAGHADTADFDLQAGETKIVTAAAFCHDPRQSLKFSIAELHFPEREAEKARLEAQKAAAEKAAAEEAAAKKAAKEKAAADQAAAEAKERERVKQEAEAKAKAGEHVRQQTAEEIKAGEREAQESRNAAAEGEDYRNKRQYEAQNEANAHVNYDELANEQFRNGELILGAPLGFQSTTYTTGAGTEGRFTYGVRGGLRLYKWVTKHTPRGAPVSGDALEFAISAGISTTKDLGTSTYASKTYDWGGHMHARYWYNSFAIGAFGEWEHQTHTPTGGMDETYDRYTLGPEVAFGIIASRSLGLEAALRAGAVASGSGLKLDTSKDVYAAASLLAEYNYLYGEAVATRYATSTNIDSWNALAVLGVRMAF